MGKKTVRWKDLKLTPGISSCRKCCNIGIIQGYDPEYGSAYYYHCDCYHGKHEKEKEGKVYHDLS